MLWGAFNNASSAMQVFSTDLGSISQNIANVNTTGYKRQEMMFSTVMSEHHAAPTSYLNGLNIFGVQATQRNLIEAQGVITTSNTWSDLAINGKGFFMVAPPTAGTAATSAATAGAGAANVPTSINIEDPQSVMYTRDGAWHRVYGPDTDDTLAREYFVNNQGAYLLGWMADETGTIPDGAELEPIYTLAPRPIPNNGTRDVDENTLLDPSAVSMPGRTTTSASVLANVPRDAEIGGTRTVVSVDDSLGNTHSVVLDWTRTGAQSWDVVATSTDAPGWSATWPVTVDDIGDIDSPLGLQNVAAVPWNSGVADIDLDIENNAVKRGDIQKIPIQVYDSNCEAHTLTLQLERTGVNSWYLFQDLGDDVTPGAAPDPITLNFDNNGKLINPVDGLIADTLSWTDTLTGEETTASLTLDISKLTQYAGNETYIGNVDQDGYADGLLLTTAFNDVGELQGYFDNGHSRTLFKVPVANFVAENSLEPVSGTMFRRTSQAGDVTVSAIEDSVGEGRFATSALENSTVEIEDEFTRMIMTQKAYSTNAQVFKTADEMTTTARDLKT